VIPGVSRLSPSVVLECGTSLLGHSDAVLAQTHPSGEAHLSMRLLLGTDSGRGTDGSEPAPNLGPDLAPATADCPCQMRS
jgi:hypothetical protein